MSQFVHAGMSEEPLVRLDVKDTAVPETALAPSPDVRERAGEGLGNMRDFHAAGCCIPNHVSFRFARAP